MNLLSLANIINGTTKYPSIEWNGISIDSRKIKPSQLFFAIKGEQFDGHNYIEDAIKQGAAAAIISNTHYSNFPSITVTDTIQALGQLAHFHRSMFTLPVVALTGSCGKTTTKEMIASILKVKGNVLHTPGNRNNHIGVPLTLLELTHSHNFAVFELGANAPGEIMYTTKLVNPDTVLLNNIAPAHVQGFGSIEGVLKAKSEIFSATKSGQAVINIDDEPYFEQLKNSAKHLSVFTFGLNKKADFKAVNIELTPFKSSFTLVCPKGKIRIEYPLAGKHNLYNALAATAATSPYVDLEIIAKGLLNLTAIPGRLNYCYLNSTIGLIDDTYNANPKATHAALEYLSTFPGKKIFVFGDMAELGKDTDLYHFDIGSKAKALNIDYCLTHGKFSALTSKAFGAGLHFINKYDLSNKLLTLIQPNTTILVKGSRSARMEEVVEHLKRSFSV